MLELKVFDNTLIAPCKSADFSKLKLQFTYVQHFSLILCFIEFMWKVSSFLLKFLIGYCGICSVQKKTKLDICKIFRIQLHNVQWKEAKIQKCQFNRSHSSISTRIGQFKNENVSLLFFRRKLWLFWVKRRLGGQIKKTIFILIH